MRIGLMNSNKFKPEIKAAIAAIKLNSVVSFILPNSTSEWVLEYYNSILETVNIKQTMKSKLCRQTVNFHTYFSKVMP